MNHPTVVVNERARRRLKSKHPWIFSNEITKKPHPPVLDGDLVRIVDAGGHYTGTAYYNNHTLIAARILAFQNDWDLRARAGEALALRKLIRGDNVYRLIFSESDGIPGLIVDRYNDTLVAQLLTAGIEKMREEILAALKDLVQPARILLRNDSPYRRLEELNQSVEWVFGTPLPEEVLEFDGSKFIINYTGQKTGFFLDQRENRQQLARYSKRGSMLDVFSYTGSWSVYAAAAGMKQIKAIDSSAEALRFCNRHAELNGFSLETIESDAMDYLREEYPTNRRYDTIVLDPPAFAKSRKHVPHALKAYREANLRAMKLLSPGGVLFTCSCSQALLPEVFEEMLRQAAAASGRTFRLLEMRSQAPDHPIVMHFPESRYLKCAILQLQ